MSTWSSFWQWYFGPRSFELRDNGRVYRLLGIRFFKRYLPTSGDIVTRRRGKRRIPAYNTGSTADLLRYEKVTRTYEARHIVGAISMLLLSLWSIECHGKGNWLVLIAGNMLVNGYPIMLQRYNRVRLQLLLEKLKHRSVSTAPLTTT